ncbi:glycosyltransferase family 2 protein [Caldimonas tepidiphila]|uniref:glycosyltransferase family 2 protein n=1 Tax=Caldimonas tepidiphila TaxID=2315841 RepID=UPI001300BCE1|nr:hypothetical protein [Caldimonas tepidiphila]
MSDIFNFNQNLVPYTRYQGRDYYRIQGMEKLIIGGRHLFFAASADTSKNFDRSGIQLEEGEWLATGTFRNSLYVEPIAQLSSIRGLSVLVEFEGVIRFKMMRATRNGGTQVIKEVVLQSSERAQHVLNIGSPTDLPEGSRLFWHIDALNIGVTIYDVSYVTMALPNSECRLAVLLRTFGRTTDVKAILRRFVDAARQDRFYASLLSHVNFWVLDTTAGSETQYVEDWQKELNLRVLVGPNLGGGGNAGHLLKLFSDACDASKTPPTEVLMLDDDLSLSMESLARYFMFCAYRTQDIVCSLPVLMKSRPAVVWEDGGFWGRLNDFQAGAGFNRKRNLFPFLLKHGRQLDSFGPLDDFCALNTCEYSTFIFFGMPMRVFQKIGYPACFFLRGDDIEYSLRAYDAGVPMITNPNLAAWHEPAHSYGQEYMAILHGVIINLTYSDSDVDFYVRFFEERMHEHLSIDDLSGLDVYKRVLAELLDPQSKVLTENFQSHYIPVLKELGAIKAIKIPDVDKDALERRAAETGALIVPFVYPGYHKHTGTSRSIVVVNHGARSYREIQAPKPGMRTAVLCEYANLLGQLSENFAEIRARWQQRLATTSAPKFWESIRDRYVTDTREIYCEAAVALENFDSVEDAFLGYDKGGEAYKGDQKQKKQSGKRQGNFIKAVQKYVSPVKPQTPVVMEAASVISKAAGGGFESLPADFDPAVYLHINDDVKAAGLDPRKHYLLYGMKEGRKYKI